LAKFTAEPEVDDRLPDFSAQSEERLGDGRYVTRLSWPDGGGAVVVGARGDLGVHAERVFSSVDLPNRADVYMSRYTVSDPLVVFSRASDPGAFVPDEVVDFIEPVEVVGRV
jgi:hypothetical protein